MSSSAQGGGYRPPPGFGAPGGPWPPPGGFGSPPGSPSGPHKPITGSPQTMAMHAMTIDPKTGLPRGEKPPASAASVVSIVCGMLLCLGPLTAIPAIIAGILARSAIRRDPNGVGGGTMAIVGIVLGILNLCAVLLGLAIWLISAVF